MRHARNVEVRSCLSNRISKLHDRKLTICTQMATSPSTRCPPPSRSRRYLPWNAHTQRCYHHRQRKVCRSPCVPDALVDTHGAEQLLGTRIDSMMLVRSNRNVSFLNQRVLVKYFLLAPSTAGDEGISCTHLRGDY